MSQTDVSYTDNQNQLEASMKELLEKILTYMEKFIKTKEDLTEIESKLNDYDNLVSLMDIIKSIFVHLTEKVDGTINNTSGALDSSSTNESEYEQLEKVVQKHEAEIRTHIRLEQQLKLYAESLQTKLEESEKTRAELLESTKNLINGVKRDNQKLSDTNKNLKDENEKLIDKLKQFEQKEKNFEEKIQNMPFLQEKIFSLEKIIQSGQERASSHSMHALQKENSYKKLSHIDLDQKKKLKSETPPVAINNHQVNSPGKQDRRTPTPNILSSGKNSTKDFKNSYQRFYNQVKQARDESLRNNNAIEISNTGQNHQNLSNKDLRNVYGVQNSQIIGGARSNSKDRDTRNISSTLGAQLAGNQKNHKRSQSHQVNKMRGAIGNNKQQTDYSRLSNQDFSDLALAGSMIQQEIIKKSQH